MLSKRIQRLFSTRKSHAFKNLVKTFQIGGKAYKYFALPELKDKRIELLPYSIRVLLECGLRNCDEFSVKTADVNNILDWSNTSQNEVEIPFKPARVLLQDFTGVPSIVDLAAMRDAVYKLKLDPNIINPLCPVDLVIDHSVQVDVSSVKDALSQNQSIEFQRNQERFKFLKWGQESFKNLQIIPPGSGICHQVNLEYLAKVVFKDENQMLYPDSLVGADSHTTMINGLGVVGWGVGGIEAESVMLGQCISMVLPKVVGVRVIGKLNDQATATDTVLTLTKLLRQQGVVGKFVEFFGEGLATLALADRATIANMAPEYGATMGFFPVDQQTLNYLALTGRNPHQLEIVEKYMRAQCMFNTGDKDAKTPTYSDELLLDLSKVQPCVAGPKRPHDLVPLDQMKSDWDVGFKGFGLLDHELKQKANFYYKGEPYCLNHGSVVIAGITSCTNTSNPDSMLQAGLLAKAAVEKGLKVKPYIKTALAPGSEVASKYFEEAKLQTYLNELGFNTTGYGCMVCIGNTGELDKSVDRAITEGGIVASAVLSGNRNFEARIHPNVRANYLMSPALVVAFALAGTTDIDFLTTPIGEGTDKKPVFLKDIWPSREIVQKETKSHVKPEQFVEVYKSITKGNKDWQKLKIDTGLQYKWDPQSTYINNPPFFKDFTMNPGAIQDISNAYCFLNFGDSITTDHISPAGKIAKNSPAAKYLIGRKIQAKDFNTYGTRRGNDEVMARGTFANTRILNNLVKQAGPTTMHFPTNQEMSIYDAAMQYKNDGHHLIILAGNEYGTGSSRDWAAKGPYLLGIKAVIAQSFERIHRSNLVGMGILPLQFIEGQGANELGLTGQEQFSIKLNEGNLQPGQIIKVHSSTNIQTGFSFGVKVRLDTDVEVEYFKNGGILAYVMRKIICENYDCHGKVCKK